MSLSQCGEKCCAPVKYTTPVRGQILCFFLYLPKNPDDFLVVFKRRLPMMKPVLVSSDSKDSSASRVTEYKVPSPDDG